ncbi:MAG: DUF6515 family protein [Ignavibacteriaceae bacterium]
MRSKSFSLTLAVVISIMLISIPFTQNFSQPPGRGGRHGGGHHSSGVHHHNNHHSHHQHHSHHHHHHHGHMHMWHPHAFWHPIGFLITALAVTAIVVAIANSGDNTETVYYDQGTYYQKSGDGYKVVTAPVGAITEKLPSDYSTIQIADNMYYYYGGDYYKDYEGGKYIVVTPPKGASVSYLPDGYETKEIDGVTYYVYNGVWYQAKTQSDNVVYVVDDKQTG